MNIRNLFTIATCLILAVSGAGCIGPVYVYGKQCAGESGTVTERFSVSGSGSLFVALGGQYGSGSVEITIRNPSGNVAYSTTFSGAGQEGKTSTINGMNGEWTVTYVYHYFTGQMGLTITQG
jgi:hypothetical protein